MPPSNRPEWKTVSVKSKPKICFLQHLRFPCYCQIFSGFAFPFEPLVISFALLSLVFVVFAAEMLV